MHEWSYVIYLEIKAYKKLKCMKSEIHLPRNKNLRYKEIAWYEMA